MSSSNLLRGLAPIALGMLAACSAADTEADPIAGESEITETKLEVAQRAKLPVDEVSGLGRRTLAGKAQYLAVPDAETALVTFDVDAAGRPSKIAKHDLSRVFGGGASQWEAVAGDAAGAVYVLTEAADTISVLDPELKRIVHTIRFSLPRHHALEDAWKADANSRAEGMLLLANGHVLVVKEKNPVALVELAPPGEDAQGYRADLALGDRAFPLPSGGSSTMTVVHHWLLKSGDTRTVSDVSELALDVDGRLLLLSDQGRSIVRVERELRPGEAKVDLKAVFKLPSAVDKPEGLVLADGVPLVAIDQKNGGDALFALGRMP